MLDPRPDASLPCDARTSRPFASLISAAMLAGLAWGHAQAADAIAQPAEPVADSMEDAIRLVKSQHGGQVTSAKLDCDGDAACHYTVEVRATDGARQIFAVATSVNPNSSLSLKTAPSLAPSRSSWSAFLTLGAGQIAGLGNVILDPLVQAGVSTSLVDTRLPGWEADGTLRLIYGRTESSDPTTLNSQTSKPALQEYRGQAHVIYNYERDGDAAKAGIGLYVDMARPVHEFPRYTPPEANAAYSAEEGEVATTIFDTGLDFRFSLHQQRVASELHNVVFINGSRIAPNLLTYKPMLGFMWSNQFAITGSIDHPGWTFSTGVDFYFARKAGVRYFNGHDGIGGTKRELDLSYGVTYNFDDQSSLAIKSYGYNNLNRGSSSMVPVGFKDGLSVTLMHRFN